MRQRGRTLTGAGWCATSSAASTEWIDKCALASVERGPHRISPQHHHDGRDDPTTAISLGLLGGGLLVLRLADHSKKIYLDRVSRRSS